MGLLEGHRTISFLIVILCTTAWQVTADFSYNYTINHGATGFVIGGNGTNPQGVGGGASNRVVGGTFVSIHQFPYHAVMRYKGHLHDHCGGARLNDLWIIAASHCMIDAKTGKQHDIHDLEIATNVDDLHKIFPNARSIAKVVFPESIRKKIGKPHPDLNSADIVLVKSTATLLPFPAGRSVIKLPKAGQTFTGKKVYFTGFGNTNYKGGNAGAPTTRMKGVQFKVFDDDKCYIYLHYDPKSNVCAGSDAGGVAPSDSGGPLAYKDEKGDFTLVGVASRSVKGYPGIFIDVAYFADFIKKTIQT